MPQMQKPEKQTRIRQFLSQDLEKKLTPLKLPRLLLKRGGASGWFSFFFPALLFLCLSWSSCAHTPESLPAPESNSQVFEADEKIILKAITRIFKDRGFGEPKMEADKGRLETDYVVQGDWRTKAIATVKKISRKEKEVTLSVITEQKSSSGWQPKKLLGKEQYEKIFSEIEMQIYREWYKAE